MKHLLSRQEYIDNYDKITVEECRRKEDFYKNAELSEKLKQELDVGLDKTINEMVLYYALLFITTDRYENKEKTINEWIERDSKKDELYENAESPKGVRCLKCRSMVTPINKTLYDYGSDKIDRVLFMYDCPNKCLPRRAMFNNGDEYIIRATPCPKCNSLLVTKSQRIKDEKVITTDTCATCDYTKVDEFNLKIKPEKVDPNFEKDRNRFCLSEEAFKKSQDERFKLKAMSKLVDSWDEKEKNKVEYEFINNLKKLNVVALERLLIPICEKVNFVKFQFGTPDMGKDLIIPFTVQDAIPDRSNLASSHDLQRVLKKALIDSNWRLMSEGVTYRMGILSGRLRAYEREEDLLKLAKQSLSK
jgi:DNA-directed RNA polymerase subunit M/transcription elongation factor TFIIS